MEPNEINEALKKAATILEKSGWCQGNLRWGVNDQCGTRIKHCIIGACIELRENWKRIDDIPSEMYKELAFRIKRDYGTNTPITAWNDKPERTKEEVIALLKGEL